MEARMVQPLDYCPYTTSPFSYSYGDSISFYNTPAHTISFFNHNEIQPAEQELEDYFSAVIKSKFLFFIPPLSFHFFSKSILNQKIIMF